MTDWVRVSTPQELTEAVGREGAAVEVEGTVKGMPMITLAPGVKLKGGVLEFGARGVRLTRDNQLEGVTVRVPPHETAVLNDVTAVDTLGTLLLRDVTTVGQVLLVAEGTVRAGHVRVEGLTVETADLRGRAARPHGFSVDAMQGAFTLWNKQTDASVELTAELLDIAVGSADQPVRGSGVFVGGHGDWEGAADGGTIKVARLRTGEVHTDGGISAGAADLISGGVFVISGAVVDEVINVGPTTTYGQNDMALDNWGYVKKWTATAEVTTNGASGIGFVNFGDIEVLEVQAPIVTTGTGARGFNLYDGSLQRAVFRSIATTGDGAIGIQISRDLPELEVKGDVTTSGGKGSSLVRGVQMELTAIAFSIKPGGKVRHAVIGGKLASRGDRVVTADLAGELDTITVHGGIHAEGARSDAVHVSDDRIDLDGIDITAKDGERLVRNSGS